MHRISPAAGLLALALLLAACGSVDTPTDTRADPASGTCLEGTPDCDDTAGQADGQQEPVGEVFHDEAAIAQAQELLGLTEAELGADVRVGRQGEEQLMLTEDYLLARMTVELTDAPQTFTRYLQ